MKIRDVLRCGRTAAAIAILAAAAVARASTCPTSNVVQEPSEFLWTQKTDGKSTYFSGTLELGQATLTVGDGTFNTRAYRQSPRETSTSAATFSIPGPTIRMTPGRKYVLTLKNSLPWMTPSTAENDFRDPNMTNLHTHGLHVSPRSPADDVLRAINGGECGDYVYALGAEHMGGTLWYHPHHHGATHLQVSGGALGFLLVNDATDAIPPKVAAMTERQLAVAYVDPAVAGTGGDTIVTNTFAPTWTVNGKVRGNLCTTANEWQHWRVLLARSNAMNRTVSVGSGCEVALLARDGVWRTVAPKVLSNNAIDVTGASRADLAVRCKTDSTLLVDGAIVAMIYADSTKTPNTTVGPFSNGATGTTWSAKRPGYLRDLRSVTKVESRIINMGARTINGTTFDMHVPTFSITAGNVQEWQIKGAGAHPWHLHVYHFQMRGACGPFEDGEYYDTLGYHPCYARFDLNPRTASVYDGATIMHCHILDHEDQGAMGWNQITGGLLPPTYPAASPTYKLLYDGAACASR